MMDNGFIVNCDDFGMHPTVNEGIADILDQGIIRSTSIMATGRAFEDAIQRLKRLGIDRCGVHLTLNSEYPKLPCGPLLGQTVASLCNSQGYFLADPLQMRASANIEHIKQEWLAQISKIENTGIRLTHLDGHMFCYDPTVGGAKITAVAQEVSETTGLPIRFLNPDGSKPYPKTHFIWEGFDDQKSRFDYYRNILTTHSSGIAEIIIHPAKDLSRLTTFTGAGERRISDYQFFSSEIFRDIVSRHQIKILDYESPGLDCASPDVESKGD